jgi:hypothetical protein
MIFEPGRNICFSTYPPTTLVHLSHRFLSPFWLLKRASEHVHALLLPRLSWSWTVLLHSDTHIKPITSITVVLLPVVTNILTLPRTLCITLHYNKGVWEQGDENIWTTYGKWKVSERISEEERHNFYTSPIVTREIWSRKIRWEGNVVVFRAVRIT